MKSRKHIQIKFDTILERTSQINEEIKTGNLTDEQLKDYLTEWREHNAWLDALNWVRQY